MKHVKTERLFLILSLLMIVVASGIYFTFARNYMGKPLSNVNQKQTSQVKKTNYLSKAIEAVRLAEEKPSSESIDTAQKLLDKVKKSETKLSLQDRLDKLKKNLSIEKEALKKLEEAEKNPSAETKEAAQKAIDKVKDEKKKADYQSRLDAITLPEETAETAETEAQTDTATVTPDAGATYTEQAPAEAYVPQAPAVEPTTPPAASDPGTAIPSTPSDNAGGSTDGGATTN